MADQNRSPSLNAGIDPPSDLHTYSSMTVAAAAGAGVTVRPRRWPPTPTNARCQVIISSPPTPYKSTPLVE
ncbi:MAG: hypothetical protein CO182_01000 [Lysobacterales bacterium CG_4_9_14_3_um_filter_62_6]|nr:MAG: hypothetical protein CO182_01000 [Xanthomonadales bacterium CG_4_9_14_3_um_filter_62_6]